MVKAVPDRLQVVPGWALLGYLQSDMGLLEPFCHLIQRLDK
jgi:hypothetical protein